MKKIAGFLVLSLFAFFLFCQKGETPDEILERAGKLESEILRCAERISQCKSDYEKILIKFPDSDAAAVACFKLGRLNELFGHFKDAADYYRKLAQIYPESPLCDEGLFRLARLYRLNLDKPDDAIEIYQQLRHIFPASEWAAKSCLEQAEVLLTQSKPDKAIAVYREFISDYPDNGLLEDVYFRIAEIYQFKIKNSNEALKLYQKLIEEFPQDSWAELARKRVEELKKGDEKNEKE